jgi:hypothetical protein
MKGTKEIQATEINDRLNDMMLKIERAGILLEEAKLDPGLTFSIGQDDGDELEEIFSDYEGYIDLLVDATEDTIKGLQDFFSGGQECYEDEYEEIDADLEEPELDEEEQEDNGHHCGPDCRHR